MKSIVYTVVFLSICVSCNYPPQSKVDFYSHQKSGDLWRVPLIKPYEVVSPTNSDSDDWFLILKNHTIEGPNFFRSGNEFQLSSIQAIGILDSIIVATNKSEYWPKLGGKYPSTLILNLKTKKQFLFSNKHHSLELKEKMTDLKLDEIEMIEWQKVKNDFLEKKKLPENWNNQRLNTKSKTNWS